ncbi:MAG: putative lipid II flippase FtsW [Candidatus Aminicenantes bacterium]|nr:putative lipid II flippase FtsW [Candidatus Aminicenantes bacterium]
MEIFRQYGFDKPLFFVVLILIAFGLIMVFSSSAILAGEKYQQPFYFFINQVMGVGLGLAVILVMLLIPKPFYQNTQFIYGFLILTFLLLGLSLAMPALGSTNRWIHFYGLRFQPSELAKISLILFIAYYLDKKKERLGEVKTVLVPLAVILLALLLIIIEPDYGSALLLFVICTVMLFIGGLKIAYFIFLGAVSSTLFVFYLFNAQYRMDRITAFLSPTSDRLGSGFQIIQSKLAVGSGGLFGVSIGESTQKLFFLPCAHTDYIYAIIGEELGLVGTLAILLLFGIFLWRGLLISWRAPDAFSRIVAAGLTLAIFGQALLNISIVLGLGPPTGLPLPLISFGRSSLLCTLFSIGILLHISQRKKGSRSR